MKGLWANFTDECYRGKILKWRYPFCTAVALVGCKSDPQFFTSLRFEVREFLDMVCMNTLCYMYKKISNHQWGYYTYSIVPASWGKHSHSWSFHSGSAKKTERNNPIRLKRLSLASQDFIDSKKRLCGWRYLFCFFEVAKRCFSLSIVEVEGIVIIEVTLDKEKQLLCLYEKVHRMCEHVFFGENHRPE